MILKLTYDSYIYETDFFLEDYSRKEIYYNNLNQADNSAVLTIPYNVEIQNFINLYSDKNILGQIVDNENVIWTGYLRKNYNFGKKQKNQPLKIELVSPSYLLDKETTDYFVLQNTDLGTAVNSLLSKAGFSSSIKLSESIGLFQIQPNTNIKSTLTELLLNYGYCFDFDNEGTFIVYPLFNKPELKSITQVFDGKNSRDEIKIEKKETEFNGTSVQWSQVESVNNRLIFADTTGGNNESFSCSITLQPGHYLGEVENASSYYIQYDCADGKVLHATEARLTIESSNNKGLTYSFNNLGNQGELSVYNSSSSPIVISKIVVYGNAYVEKAERLSRSVKGNKYKEIKTSFIHSSSYADLFAQNYTDWLNYADYIVSLKSFTDYPLGTFVKVFENGIGTIYGRIIEKVYNLKKEPIQYKIEAISDYEPAEVNSITTKKSTALINGIVGKDGEDGTSISSSSVDYQSSSSGTTVPTGTWLNYIPTVSNGNYLWCRTTVNYSDGTTTQAYSVSYIPTNGKNGSNGSAGVGISSITEYYLASSNNSGITTSTSGWTTTTQSVSSSKKYLWNYEKITFTDSSTQNTTPVIIGNYASDGKNGSNGSNGSNGKDGKGISSITEYYLATSSGSGITASSSGWTTTIQTITSSKKYLWNYETITYTDSSSTKTTPAIIGVYGEKGEQGIQGIQGIQGKQGEKGEQGIQGIQGKQGEKGNTGVSMRNKGTWASGTAYVNNSSYIDIVYYSTNGCSYSCIKSHTASSSILPTNTTYWSLIASKGDKGNTGSSGTAGKQGVRGAQYRGAFNSAPTTDLINGDWYLNTTDGYCYYYTSSASPWSKITNYSDYRYLQAMEEMINLSATLTSNESLTAAVNTWIQNLVAGTALINKLFAKEITVQKGGSIQSSNFVSGSSGFKIYENGTIEANTGRFRGGIGTTKTLWSVTAVPQQTTTVSFPNDLYFFPKDNTRVVFYYEQTYLSGGKQTYSKYILADVFFTVVSEGYGISSKMNGWSYIPDSGFFAIKFPAYGPTGALQIVQKSTTTNTLPAIGSSGIQAMSLGYHETQL